MSEWSMDRWAAVATLDAAMPTIGALPSLMRPPTIGALPSLMRPPTIGALPSLMRR